MKKILITTLMLCLGAFAYARVDVDVGLGVGVPAPTYYAEPPPYYDPSAEADWMAAPVQVTYFNGAPHRMHYWNGHWYDEAWRGGHGNRSWHDTDFNDHDWHRGH